MDQLDFLKRIVSRLDQANLVYMIVGSYASGYWGEPRSTYDVDIAITLSPIDLPSLQGLFPTDEFYISPEAALEAIITRTQFNVIHSDSGNKVDFMVLNHSGWAGQQLARRRHVEFTRGFRAWVGAPEDIIIGKMLYYREGASDKHLRDIAGVLKVSGNQIDCDYINHWARELEILDIWQTIFKRTKSD